MKSDYIKGILKSEGGQAFICNQEKDHFRNRMIWDGYIQHWLGKDVCARELEQRDYERNEKIVILWPYAPPVSEPFVEFYYNERLIKYAISFFGHNAINVNGSFYNFSHLLNENEVMTPEEFFYRPALGEFAPSPNNGKFEIDPNGRVYLDKFGRNFMRTIHVLRMKGIQVDRLREYFDHQLYTIHATPVNPKKPEKYAEFNYFTRSCSTIIRDGLKVCGLKNISGFLPKDLFINILYTLYSDGQRLGIEWELLQLPQLKVKEAPYSKQTPLMDIINRIHFNQLKIRGVL